MWLYFDTFITDKNKVVNLNLFDMTLEVVPLYLITVVLRILCKLKTETKSGGSGLCY